MMGHKRWSVPGWGAAILLILGGCESSVIIDDWGTAGYAILQGEVVRASGSLYSGDLFISCGLDEPGFFGSSVATDSPGWYRASIEWPEASMADTLAAIEWRAICRVSVPAGSPPFASAVDTVVFAPTEQERVENTIDLREEQGQ